MVYDDSFVEQVKASPDRLHPGQVVDWTVHWQGRQQVSGLAASSTLASVLQHHEAHALAIQVFNMPSDTWEENDMNSYTNAAAGLSVTATFAVDAQAVANNHHRAALENLLETKFRHLLLTLLSERWILGSLESVHNERLHRFVHVDWQNLVVPSAEDSNGVNTPTAASARVPVVLWLSHEAFSLAAEGIQAFVQNLYPCQSTAGILAVNSATEWSNLLLGHEGASSSTSSITVAGRRGLWMQVTARENNENESYQINMGLTWRIRTKGPTVAWSNLLGDAKLPLQPCPLADATRFTVLDNPAVPVTTNEPCNGLSSNVPNILHDGCIRIPTDAQAKMASVANANTLSVQTNLWRSKGPGHSGRIETIVDNPHESCAARVQIWHVIPPVLQPVWSSFDSSTTAAAASVDDGESTTMSMVRPQRRWKHDGTIVLTLDTNLTAKSVLRYGFDYDPVFLPIESFPADPNRGFELPPVRVVVVPLCNSSSSSHGEACFALFSESLLFLSPLPDASMPFNVLSLSCTLVAFVIGSILNLLVRRASEKIKYTLHPEQQPKSKIQKFKDIVRKKIQSMRGMEEEAESDNKQKDD